MDVSINPIQKWKEATPPKNDSPNVQKKGKEPTDPTSSKVQSANEKSNQPSATKKKIEKKDAPVKEVEKNTTFSLENEIAKLKVSIPLTELMKNRSYKGQVAKILNIDPLSNMLMWKMTNPSLSLVQHYKANLRIVMFTSALDCMIMFCTTPCLIQERLTT